MNARYFQLILFIIALIGTFINIYNRFFTKRVNKINVCLITVFCIKTTVTYETRKLTEIEFPTYFSLVSNPGYDISFLDSHGIDGEWDLFIGNFSDGTWRWGSVNHSIGGKLNSLRTINYIFFVEIFGLRVDST